MLSNEKASDERGCSTKCGSASSHEIQESSGIDLAASIQHPSMDMQNNKENLHEGTQRSKQKDEVVVNIVRQSVSPLSMYTPQSTACVRKNHTTADSADYTPSSHFYDAMSSPSSSSYFGSRTDTIVSGERKPYDSLSHQRPQKKFLDAINLDQDLEKESVSKFHDALSSPLSTMKTSETMKQGIENKADFREDFDETDKLKDQANSSFACDSVDPEKSMEDSVGLQWEENSIGTEHKSVQASMRDSDSFDWRNEISPIVQAKYKPKRRSSFLFSQHPSMLLQSPVMSPPMGISNISKFEHLTPKPVPANSCQEQQENCPVQPKTTQADSVLETDQDSADESESGEDLGNVFLEAICEYQEERVIENSGDSEIEALRRKCKRLELENKNLRNSLASKTRSYDDAIGPFRNLFEALPKLRKESECLRQENALLKKEKADMEAGVTDTIQQLQLQMTNAVQVAVEKTTSLQEALQASLGRNAELEAQLAHLQASQEVTERSLS